MSAALRDEDADVREAAAQALGKLGDAQAVPTLSAALRDENADVRRVAAQALVQIGAQAVPALSAALRDKNADVCEAAAQALGKIVQAWPLAEPGKARRQQHRTLQQLAHALQKGGHFGELEVVLERLAEIEAAAVAFDPLAPEQPSGLRRVGGWVFWVVVAGLVGAFLVVVQEVFKDTSKDIWGGWLAGQPLPVRVSLMFALAALIGLGGWAAERWKKAQPK
ncbi:MAG: hypothetical protein DDG58_14935 [Ardenticatenia bacterium]|nr:MAG: hypothetical protein DDG58_14935 [Ardenticatenia bacterium]